MIGGITESAEKLEADRSISQFVGDLLLIFGPGGGVLRGRNQTSPASILAQNDEWSLYSFPTTSHWKGYPMMEFSFPDWRVWLLGEIYGVSDSEEAQAIVKDSIVGLRDFAKLNGHYFVFAWNSKKSQWNIWTNRLGTLHAYNGKNAIGTCFNSIVRASGDLDLDSEGILGFFSLGFFPQDRTYSKGVRIIRPATHEVYSAAGKKISEKRYWNWIFNPDTARNYDNTVEEFAALLNEVMSDLCRNGRIAVPISGGLDSRSTIAAVLEKKSDVIDNLRAFSYGYTPDSVEIRIARLIAAARNLPFDSYQIPKYLFDSLSNIYDAIEGFQDITLSRQASVSKLLSDHSEYVIAAHWGDVWLDDLELGEVKNDNEILSAALQKFRKRGSNWLLQNVNTSLLQSIDVEKMVSGMIEQELVPLAGIDDPEFRLKALKTEQWSFRWTTSSIRSYQLGVFPRLPFYDSRMIDFFATVPSEFVRERRMQVDYLIRFAPDLARVRWQAYDTDLFKYKRSETWHLPKRALNKVRRILLRQPLIQRNWEAQFLNEQGRVALKQYLLNGAGSKIEEFFPSSEIASLLDDLYNSPSAEKGYAVSMLLTFAAWLGKDA
jgi:asparagine synthetase B (glutamine-hydrolysing)